MIFVTTWSLFSYSVTYCELYDIFKNIISCKCSFFPRMFYLQRFIYVPIYVSHYDVHSHTCMYVATFSCMYMYVATCTCFYAFIHTTHMLTSNVDICPTPHSVSSSYQDLMPQFLRAIRMLCTLHKHFVAAYKMMPSDSIINPSVPSSPGVYSYNSDGPTAATVRRAGSFGSLLDSPSPKPAEKSKIGRK